MTYRVKLAMVQMPLSLPGDQVDSHKKHQTKFSTVYRSKWTRALRTVVESGFTAVVTFQGWNSPRTFLVRKAVYGLFINYARLGNVLPTLELPR